MRGADLVSEEKSADRRSELLDLAATVFETAGIRASIADIARASGIKSGSLYHHFESKEAIILELVERYLADLEALASVPLRAPTPRVGCPSTRSSASARRSPSRRCAIGQRC